MVTGHLYEVCRNKNGYFIIFDFGYFYYHFNTNGYLMMMIKIISLVYSCLQKKTLKNAMHTMVGNNSLKQHEEHPFADRNTQHSCSLLGFDDLFI